jgi:putative NIF3 family GTP cyclohydrolase 1 type 2
MRTIDLIDYTGRLLEVSRFRDYCPNGLQVEGRGETRRLVSGVTASVAFLERAIATGADTVLVHHGYFWKNEPAPVTGPKKARLLLLLKNEVNLAAYHLPLDAHPEFGNNAQLGRRLGIAVQGWFGDQEIAAWGVPEQPLTLGSLAEWSNGWPVHRSLSATCPGPSIVLPGAPVARRTSSPLPWNSG